MTFAYRAALVLALAAGPASADAPGSHTIFRVTLPASANGHVSGRLLLFATPAAAGTLPDHVAGGEFGGTAVNVAAQEVADLAPGGTVEIDADTQAYPAGFSSLKPGDYALQAVLDTRHDYAYADLGAGDLVSGVVRAVGSVAAAPALALATVVPAADPWAARPGMPPSMADALTAAKAHATALDYQSAALTRFWGRPTHMRGWVLTPPGYNPKSATRYPTVYYTHGFGGNMARLTGPLAYVNAAMEKHEMPPMIWVFLDQSCSGGTHEFADSANNGPWGQALTGELIPALEKQYRMDGKASGRFLQGHSSGGWATLWLQTRYPAVFGGTWSTSPDPSDFHDFTNTNLYAPGANTYHRADGSVTPLVRMDGKDVASFQQFAQMEAVLGSFGGQISSFDWVFSPRGADGRPVPMFNRVTGTVDPAVVAYWHDHYDIAYLVTSNWGKLKPDLDGKIHLYVGTADTFYLDGAAHLLQAALDGVHAHTEFRFIPGRSHFDLYKVDQDRYGLLKQIARDMYAQARPGK